MLELYIAKEFIPPMTDMEIDKVRKFEEFALHLPQTGIDTSHILHGGVYARTIMLPAGIVITGAYIKIPTMLIVQGNVIVHIGDKAVELHGYNVLPASANRKQAFIAREDAYLTMIFATDAKNIIEAEDQFTDEAHMLISRKDMALNHVTVTGE